MKSLEKKTSEQMKKEGEWNLLIYKDRPSRWMYFLQNPQGGGGGASSYSSIKSALHAGLHADFRGAKRVWVIISHWNANHGPDGDNIVTKAYWLPLPQPL